VVSIFSSQVSFAFGTISSLRPLPLFSRRVWLGRQGRKVSSTKHVYLPPSPPFLMICLRVLPPAVAKQSKEKTRTARDLPRYLTHVKQPSPKISIRLSTLSCPVRPRTNYLMIMKGCMNVRIYAIPPSLPPPFPARAAGPPRLAVLPPGCMFTAAAAATAAVVTAILFCTGHSRVSRNRDDESNDKDIFHRLIFTHTHTHTLSLCLACPLFYTFFFSISKSLP